MFNHDRILTDKQKAACLMRREGLTLHAIGWRLGVSKAAVSRLLSRARTRAATHRVVLPNGPRRVRSSPLGELENV